MQPAVSNPRSPRRIPDPFAVRASVLFLVVAGTSEVRAASLPACPGIRILSAEEILRDHVCRTDSGELLLVDATGSRRRLVTATDDPEVSNSGDGAFHPPEFEDAAAVLLEVAPEFTAKLQVVIYLLPFPRAGTLSSSSDSLAIYLSPGTEEEAVRRSLPLTLAHETGHAVQRRILPRADVEAWLEYRRLRGLTDTTLFRSDGPHADRPQEIFAEDFRVLFGGPAARGSGSIENSRISGPEQVPGLAGFLRGRLETTPGEAAPLAREPGDASDPARLFPNPARPGSWVTVDLSSGGEFTRARAEGAAAPIRFEVSVLDVTGRRIGREQVAAEEGRLLIRLPETPGTGSRALWLRLVPLDDPGSAATLPVRLLR